MYFLAVIIMDYIETWKEVIQSPSDFYSRISTTGGYTDPLTFAAISFAISGILSALLSFGILVSLECTVWNSVF
jgi:hypothetical protein